MRYPKADKSKVRAPFGKFRVLAVDLDSGEIDFVVGDFDGLDQAKLCAAERAGVGKPVYVYDDRGEVVVRYGSWH